MECESEPTHLGDVFIGHEQQLKLYIPYCRNKTASSDIYREFFSFFEELHAELKDRQKLPDYLILPVQRITKYGLLLADFHKYRLVAKEIIRLEVRGERSVREDSPEDRQLPKVGKVRGQR